MLSPASSAVVIGSGPRRVLIGTNLPLALIAGPCLLESAEVALTVAVELARIADALSIGVVFKGSFDKANRTSGASPRGPGLDTGLAILARVKAETGLPVTTDVHEPWQCALAAQTVDLLQIPAFLCRQSDLVAAAARTGRPVNIKKGPFLAPADMRHPVDKAHAAGGGGVLVTERGTSFGYNTLVSDLRGLEIMRDFAPVVFDATHSVQQPGGAGDVSGGERRFVPALARAAVAVGVSAVFLETHPAPQSAFSDGQSQIPLKDLAELIARLTEFDRLAKIERRD